MAGRPYLVGERGPEIVIPRQSGTVVPNHAIAASQPIVIQLALDGRIITEVVHEGLLSKQRRVPLGLAQR